MPNITVYVPDDLFKEMQKAKLESNKSEIFQQAIKREMKNTVQIRGNTMEKLRQKIQEEKEEFAAHSFAVGKDLAQKWAENENLDLEDFLAAKRGTFTDETKQALKDNYDYDVKNNREELDWDEFVRGFVEAVEDIGFQVGAYD